MTVFAEIQKRVKDGQAKITPYLDSALKNPTVESVVTGGKTLLEKPEIKKVLDQGQDVIKNVTDSATQLRGNLESTVKNAETQGKTLLQNTLTQVLDSTSKIENEVIEAANRALDSSAKFADEKAPFLADYIGKAREALNAVNAGFTKIQVSVKVNSGSVPIAGYDDLNAKKAAAAVKKLSNEELLVVQSYESSKKNRRTVLSEIESLLADS